jgi:hypothetical protein
MCIWRSSSRPRVSGPKETCWGAGSLGFEGTMHALMAAMLLGCAGRDARGEEPPADPPGGELGEPSQSVGGTGHSVVGADVLAQTALFE